jgi:UDP-2-acetamido-3-amino-2,3-dideoxy-glucuronate N-acetyltransferase
MIFRFFRALRNLLRGAYRDEQLRDRFPTVKMADGVIIRGAQSFTPGKGVFLDRRCYLNCTGGAWSGRRGFIKIGDNSEVGPYSVLWGAGGITIGNNVHIGAHVSITAHEAEHIKPDDTDVWKPLDFYFEPVVIEDHTLVCSGTVIIPGVTIGHHSMIGGGAVVIGNIPPYSLAVGCPARIVRRLREDEAKRLEAGENIAVAH